MNTSVIDTSNNYGAIFKECSDSFFAEINHRLETALNFEDITYLDGYFIFSYGTNSVLHFHIKECPGWLFGIWWTQPKESETSVVRICGEFFAQYEVTIDKFKPSASDITCKIEISPDRSIDSVCDDAANNISFIRNEPYLAFCRDYCGWDYNTEYHTREEAKSEYNKYRIWKSNKDMRTAECDNLLLQFVRESILPDFVDAELVDQGESCTPRYCVVAPIESNSDCPKIGTYDWFSKDDQFGQALLSEYFQICKVCKHVAEEHKFYWPVPVEPFITIYSKESMMRQ